jgi:hypothetical protein
MADNPKEFHCNHLAELTKQSVLMIKNGFYKWLLTCGARPAGSLP